MTFLKIIADYCYSSFDQLSVKLVLISFKSISWHIIVNQMQIFAWSLKALKIGVIKVSFVDMAKLENKYIQNSVTLKKCEDINLRASLW